VEIKDVRSLGERDGSQAIRRAVTLVREVSASRGGASLTDLAAAAGLTQPTAHRVLRALVDEGLLTKHPATCRYTLGPLLFELGLAASPRIDLRPLARPALLPLPMRPATPPT